MNYKTILNYIILIFLFIIVLMMRGCVIESREGIEDNKLSEIESIDENKHTEPEQEKDLETESNTKEQENEEAVQEDGNDEEITGEDNDPGSGEMEEKPDSIELSAKHVGGNPGNITMFFDLITGEVSGKLEMKYTEVSLDGNRTVVCVYLIEGDIKGSMDLEKRIITADFIGKADSDDRGCYRGELKFSLKGKISKDYSVARGTTTYGGVDWSVFK